jgi:hypothetical protein
MSFSIRKEVSAQKFIPQVRAPQVSISEVNKQGVSKPQEVSNITKKIQNFGLDIFSLHKRGERFIYSPPDVSTTLYESEELFFDKAKNRWITIPISKKN